jgi:hypothetical protein
VHTVRQHSWAACSCLTSAYCSLINRFPSSRPATLSRLITTILSQPPGDHNSQTSHMSEVKRCSSWCAWLISLNIMTGAPRWIQMTGLHCFKGWEFHCVYEPPLLPSAVSGNISCFYFLPGVRNEQGSLTDWLDFLWLYNRECKWWIIWQFFLSFWGNSTLLLL